MSKKVKKQDAGHTKMRWRCHLSSEWTQTCPCRGDLILAFKRLRLEDCHKFTATLGYRVTPCLRKQTKARKTTKQTTRRKRHGAGEVTQWLRAGAAPAENLLSAPSTHIYGRSLSFLTPVQEDSVPQQATRKMCDVHADTQSKCTFA